MNNPLSIGFVLLGFIMIIGGIIWISRLSSSEDNGKKTNDDERLINVGFGEYNTEGLVLFRGVVAIVLGIVFIAIGILI